jgi:hypothetical protein
MDIETVEAAVEQFENHLKEMPRTMFDGRIVDNISDYKDADYDALNEDWSNWLDSMIVDGIAPAEANSWDWEEIV